MPKNTIYKVRQDLELDDAHGVDSAIFYREHPAIPDFIASYRNVLARLAKV